MRECLAGKHRCGARAGDGNHVQNLREKKGSVVGGEARREGVWGSDNLVEGVDGSFRRGSPALKAGLGKRQLIKLR